MIGAWVGAALVVSVCLTLLIWTLEGRRRAREEARGRGANEALDRAELMVLQGAWDDAGAIAGAVLADLDRKRDEATSEARTRAALLLAECEVGLDRPGPALERLDRAAPGVSAENEPLARLERLVRAGISDADGPRDARRRAEALTLIREADASGEAWEPESWIRLSRLALALAEEEYRGGDWPASRALLESAVRLGERVSPEPPPDPRGVAPERARFLAAMARARASHAAGELGQRLLSLGAREEALAWLDRAVAAVEAPRPPLARLALARALIVRAMSEPPEGDPGSEARLRRLARARDVASEVDWPAARALAARAEIQAGVLRAGRGDPAAADSFRSAAGRLEGLAVRGVAELESEARLLLGHVLEDQGDPDGARAEYRRALEAGQRDEDADARRLAAVAGCHLHRLLHLAERTDEARALLGPLEALAPTLALPARPLVAAMVARCRGQQEFREGNREAADRTLRAALALVEEVEAPEASDLARQLEADRGNLALSGDAALAAESHFRAALARPAGSRPAPVERAERAELHLRLAQSLLHLEREGEARAELRRAFDHGRDSGRASGRTAAAIAALALGDRPEDSLADRRNWYESAARFGRLSGTPRGREVAEAVAERLRELAG